MAGIANQSGRTVRPRHMSISGLESIATMADLHETDGHSSTATQKLGNTAPAAPSSVKDEHKVGGQVDTGTSSMSIQDMFNHLMHKQEEQAQQIAALTADTLPSPASISAASGHGHGNGNGSVARPSGSLGAAMRSQSVPAKGSITSRAVVITPSSSEEKGSLAAAAPTTPAANTQGNDDDNELVDVGMDGADSNDSSA